MKLNRQGSRASLRSNVSSRWRDDLDNFKAIKITFYKNGDQWFEGFEFRFKPLKDYQDLESLLERISARIDFNSSVSHLFDTDGNEVEKVEDLEDRKAYVASNSKRFKAGNYGKLGEKFNIKKKKVKQIRSVRSRTRSSSSKASSSDSKPDSATSKVIKIVNNDDPTLIEKVLLNLRTAQSFEEVVEDLGQVLKIKRADRMYTTDGNEVKSFSHLRNNFPNNEVFVISSGPTRISDYVADIAMNDSDTDQSTGSRSHGRKKDKDAIEVKINGARKIYYPPEGVEEDLSAPNCKLGLEWVYGYRGADRPDNLRVLDNGELVYFLGAVVVIYNRTEERQKLYQGHTEDITCLELHPGGELVASGQEEGGREEQEAHCRVWSSFTMETRAVLGLGRCQGPILGVSFSVANRGQYVAMVDSSEDRTLSVWDWSRGEPLAEVTMKVVSITGLAFHPFDSNLLVTTGPGGHLSFWNRKKDGYFARADVGEPTENVVYTCIAFLESGDVVAGDSKGELSTFTVSKEGDYYKSLSVQAHRKGVSALLSLGDGVLISSGGQDRRLVGWDSTQDFNMLAEVELPARAGGGVALCSQTPGGPGADIYVGTNKNIILEGRLQRKFRVVVFGHNHRITTMAAGPGAGAFVTGGEDKVVVMWLHSRLLWKLLIQSEPTALAFHPQQGVVVVGSTDGYLVALNSDTGEHMSTVKVCGAAISSIKFSVEGDMVAAASTNGNIYLYRAAKGDYRQAGRLAAELEVEQIDWESKGEFIQASSRDFNLQFWNVSTSKMEKVASSLKEKEWADSTCVVGWAVAGLWGNQHYPSNSTAPTCSHASPSLGLLAAGDSGGCLRLFSHPCTSPGATFLHQKVVSGPIRAVRFLQDTQLLATGGREGAVFRFLIAGD